MSYKISIIIPYYNVEKEYLEQCLKSIVNQTYKNLEIIIINDGSSKEYSKFLDKYRCDKNFIVIDKQNGGVSSARNVGLKKATGDYCLFVDPDDWLQHNTCEKFIDIAVKNNNLDLIISKIFIHNQTDIQENYCFYENDFSVQNKQELIDSIFLNVNNKFTTVDTVWAKLYKISFLRDNNITFNESLLNSEDCVFNFECMLVAQNIFFTTQKLYNYRVNPFSACRVCSDLDKKSIKSIEVFKNIINIKNALSQSKYFNFYIVRVLCRLLRKFYNKKSYKVFKNEFSKLLENSVFRLPINQIELSQLDRHKQKIVKLCKNRKFLRLYIMMKFNKIKK